jgi:hypothetical protein
MTVVCAKKRLRSAKIQIMLTRAVGWTKRSIFVVKLLIDFERYARTVAAFVRLAMIRIMLKRLTRPTPCS